MARSQPPGPRTERSVRSSPPRLLHERGRRILIVDDAEGIRGYLANLLELRGYQVDTAEDGRRALALLEAGAAPDVILLDVMMPGLDGLETLRRIRETHPNANVVMLSVVGRAQTIVEAMQLGAVDYLNKPFEEEELEIVLRAALEKRELERERERLLGEVSSDPESAVWASPQMQQIQKLLEQISDTDVTVLIQGESGSGKEIVARAAHQFSTRREHPFVKVNCAALPPDLLESELFGYERGAFTGAVSRKPGKFEVADGGTIFLDEIGEMSPALQAKLLQVLQDGRFTRLGGNEEVRVDVRVVCATNRDLEAMVQAGTFRKDLFFRLNVVSLRLPPLRERRDEIPTLVNTFLSRYSVRYGRSRPRLSQRLLRAFGRYPFPGNVRELENMIKRIVVLGNESSVLHDVLGPGESRGLGESAIQALLAQLEETAGELPLREVGARVALEVERHTIESVLLRTNWNRKQAARFLNVSYKTLLQKIRECGLDPDG
ncbi:MAG TPA: sigma-54 dependent transcriptional regulator [Myxococcota bacterium]|nr:sigma-54 dependent transcriptional regulator [Myxococcota bacterium]